MPLHTSSRIASESGEPAATLVRQAGVPPTSIILMETIRMGLRHAFIAACALAFSGCMPQRTVAPTAPTGPGLHVLFVGNSLTYVNDLPAILEAMADSAHERLLETRMVAKPDYSLEDHWNDGEARTAIANGGWSLVVLQQGPSSLESSRTLLIQYARAFADAIHQVDAQVALYQVWPTSDRSGDFPRANESYRLAADTVHGLLFPVGEAWLAAQRIDPSIPLYAFDGLHPSGEGSYLAALVMYATLYGKSPLGLPPTLRLRNGSTFAVTGAAAATLQAAADQVTTGSRAQRWVPNAGGLQKPAAPRACADTSPPNSAELNTTRKVPVDWPRHCGWKAINTT